jgi:hypothetical protein
MRVTARSACRIMWHSGSDWQRVPSRFHKKATASRRRHLDPAIGQKQHDLGHFEEDRGLAQFRSH